MSSSPSSRGTVRLISAVAAVSVLAFLAFRYLKSGSEGSTSVDVAPSAPRGLDELCAWLQAGDNPYFGVEAHARKERELAEAEAAEDPSAILFALKVLAQSHLTFGENAKAAEHLERAVLLAESHGDGSELQNVRRQLAVAYLRSGETTHCLADHNPKRCLFPIVDEGVWEDTEPADKAVEILDLCYRDDPQSSMVRWLLNVAHMARGTYPDGLPPEAVIDVSPNDPSLSVPHFRDVAKQLGLDVFDLAGGAVVEDLDGDGFLDVVTTTIDPCGQLRYHHNEGDGSFADWTERAGLVGQLGGLNLAQGDYDGDGRLDLFVFRGAWMGAVYGRQRNSLLRQREDGSFEDVSVEAGVADVAYPCATGAWQDYDLDGDLDIYVGGELFPGQLLRNEGDGTFTDVAMSAGVENKRLTKGVSWGDFDEDGDPDLYVSNLGGGNRLYRNDGNDTFVDVASEVGAELIDAGASGLTFASWFFDYDNDGDLDLYVGGFGTGLEGFARDYLDLDSGGEPLHLLENVGGRFESVAKELGLANVHLPMGANYGDIDNDGWLDIYLGTGKPGYEFLVPNALYKNVGGERFVDVTTEAGVGHLQKGHGIAFGDVDNDGDQDLLAQMGGFYQADGFHNSFFENEGVEGRWVTLVLRGTGKNRFGVGSRIRVDVRRANGELRSIHSLVGSGGSFGASSLQQEIGLGDAEAIERIEIRWQTTGESQVFTTPPMDCFLEVTQGSNELRRLERPRIALDA